MPSNAEFLKALFGEDLPWVHVTDFSHDPGNIPPDEERRAWFGNYYSRYVFGVNTNQYFTISTFYADEENKARRRIALFRATHVVVLDDVQEKLPVEQAMKLPAPTWVLQTSAGSQQWGYLLTHPETDKARVSNLLDGLVANGLAPQGKDPGMKGVTRYVRLPDGVNNKANKLVNGLPFNCHLTVWEPSRRVTLEELAEPFAVNLEASRRETRVDGAAAVDDHPLIHIPDIISIKEKRSDGRFDITCPWVDEHTEAVDSGTAIFTNQDGTLGFKCHHGACEGRTGADLLKTIEVQDPGFGERLKSWQLRRSFESIGLGQAAPEPAPAPAPETNVSFMSEAPVAPVTILPEASEPLQQYLDQLRNMNPFTNESRQVAGKLLEVVDSEPAMTKIHWHDSIRDIMGWSKQDLKNILRDLREEWYTQKASSSVSFLDEIIFIAELNQFYDRGKRIFYTPEAFQNSYSHLDDEARKRALQGGMVTKVDKLDYAPKMPAVFVESGVTFGNSWSASEDVEGTPGDISQYLNHFDALGWGPYREHFLRWMAFTIRHPDIKINHMMMLGSMEGTGKDWLLYPLTVAMGHNYTGIEGEELVSDYQGYLLHTKYLNVNETELGDRHEAKAVSAKIKPLAAAPPKRLRCNEKNVKRFEVRNIVSVSMTTNSQLPLKLTGHSRRIFALWTDLNVYGSDKNMKPEWQDYWVRQWHWMENGGAEQVIHYLRHSVDLSDFNPGLAPPVTEFLRSIVDASKSPMLQTLEAFISGRFGCFDCDLVTASDMSRLLRIGELVSEDSMFADRKLFTPTRIGMVLGDIPEAIQLRARDVHEDFRVWAIRNAESYIGLTSKEVMDEYRRQKKKVSSQTQLKVAK